MICSARLEIGDIYNVLLKLVFKLNFFVSLQTDICHIQENFLVCTALALLAWAPIFILNLKFLWLKCPQLVTICDWTLIRWQFFLNLTIWTNYDKTNYFCKHFQSQLVVFHMNGAGENENFLFRQIFIHSKWFSTM